MKSFWTRPLNWQSQKRQGNRRTGNIEEKENADFRKLPLEDRKPAFFVWTADSQKLDITEYKEKRQILRSAGWFQLVTRTGFEPVNVCVKGIWVNRFSNAPFVFVFGAAPQRSFIISDPIWIASKIWKKFCNLIRSGNQDRTGERIIFIYQVIRHSQFLKLNARSLISVNSLTRSANRKEARDWNYLPETDDI